jgi:prepilin peptidase CpaA
VAVIRLLSLDHWPVLFLCGALILAAVIDYWKFKVPNWLTFPLILSGWLYGFGSTLGWWTSGGTGWASVVLSFFGLGLLLPLYAVGGMGPGDVKMQAGFGSWVGAIFGLETGFSIVWWGFCIAAIVGGIIGLGMMLWRRELWQNRQNMAEIVGDWLTSSSVREVADKAAKRKSRLQLLPYGIPLCIGFLAILVLRGL